MKITLRKTFMLLAALVAGVATSWAQCPGVLIVNEISNGTDGAKEFIEVIVAKSDSTGGACGEGVDSVDVTGWIIDDNNGLFNGGSAVSGVGISSGHWRLTEAAIWQKFPVGDFLVLFNGLDFDSTFTPFLNAATGAGGASNGILQTDSATYVAIGWTNAVQKNPGVPNASFQPEYCDGDAYEIADTWATGALRNSCGGDGAQTRCPGCFDFQGLGEPAFYSGISYGNDNAAQTGTFLDAAHIAFDTTDTLCGATRTFYLNSGVVFNAAEVSANWTLGAAATAATPGAPNSAANGQYQDSIEARVFVYSFCAQPAASTGSNGALIVLEISQGPGSDCEYAKVAVSATGNSFDTEVDIRGWVFDDNSGNFNTDRSCGGGKGISSGHLRLTNNSVWENVEVGSILFLYNYDATCQTAWGTGTGWPTSYTLDADNDSADVYFLPIQSTSNNFVEGNSPARPSSSNCDYCSTSQSFSVASATWSKVNLRNSTGDAFQVRCPGCNDVESAEPEFYHGIGYGRTGISGYATITATSADLGGPVKNTSSSLSGDKISLTNLGSTTPVADFGNPSNYTIAAHDTPTIVNGKLRAYVPTDATSNSNVSSTLAIGGDFVNAIPTCDFDGGSNKTADRASSTADVLDNEEAAIVSNVYPNPADNVLNFTVAFDGVGQLNLFDLNGRVVTSTMVEGQSGMVTMDITDLESGVYFYQLNTNEGAATGKIIVQ